MTSEKMLGLMMAMIVLKGATSSHVATFVSDLDPGVQKKILGLFQSELMKIFSDPNVCKWLAEHPK